MSPPDVNMGAFPGALEAQVSQLVRAAVFLARDPAAVRSDQPMPRRVMGNGLRELDIFLVDIVRQAAGLTAGQSHGRRVYCAAEAWRRAAPVIGLTAEPHAALVQLRAAQNRMTFEPAQFWVGPPYPLALACATYSRLAVAVLEAVSRAESHGTSRSSSDLRKGVDARHEVPSRARSA